jgi:methylenetetrahydrofolate reductase (NADPH)
MISLPKIFHIDLPEDLSEAVAKCKSEKEVREVGIEHMIAQCKDLIKIGAPVLHFYTMSNPGPTRKIAEAIF